MTEQDWLNCTQSHAMLEYLDDRVSYRKRRLFTAACCRRVWHLLTDQRMRTAVEVAERFVDGLASLDELRAAHHAMLQHPSLSIDVPFPNGGGSWSACPPDPTNAPRGLEYDAEEEERAARHASNSGELWVEQLVPGEGERHRIACSHLLRDLLGNPFRSITFDPGWSQLDGGLIAHLARSIYEQRDFGLLPILGDALADAGCSDEQILSHCHDSGEHVRGCWVVDLCVGREPPLRPELTTEQEWLTPTDDLRRIWRFVDGKVTARQLRLIAVACCRSVWSQLPPRVQQAVLVAERYLEGQLSPGELQAARADMRALQEEVRWRQEVEPSACAGLGVAACFPEEQIPADGSEDWGSSYLRYPRYRTPGLGAVANAAIYHRWLGGKEERLVPYHLVRDILGNPFRPTTLDPAWLQRNRAIEEMARTIHTRQQDFTQMHALGAALERAGCSDAEILAHARGPGPHVRGCWLLELIVASSRVPR